MTTDEILRAKEKELNEWVSVKKMVQYRYVILLRLLISIR